MKHIALRDARRRKRLTQAQLARRVRCPQSFISKLETGAIDDPGLKITKALGRVLDVNPLALRFGTHPTDRQREALAS